MSDFRMTYLLLAFVLCGCPAQSNEPAKASAVEQPAAPGLAPPKSDAKPESSAPPAGASSTKRTWSFDEGTPGKLPAGFVAAVGQWQVSKDETAPSGSGVFVQLAKSADHVFNVALVTDTSYRDVDLSVRLRSISGRVDQGGGPVWRARDARNYYIARYNPLEDNFRVYKVVDGRRSMLESVSLQIDKAAWHTLRIVMRADQIECYLDGKKHLSARDTTFADAGQIGLWTKADAHTQFDDLMSSAARPSASRP